MPVGLLIGPIRPAQTVIRHSTPTLTANVYTDPRLLDVEGAFDALASRPLFPATSNNREQARALETCTYGGSQLAPPLAPPLAPTGAQTGQTGGIPGNINPPAVLQFEAARMGENLLKPHEKGIPA